jgi:acyl transferase domain-containing protein/NAD(P)-dependent dehydrogenase (short-subunit alcohol dehydrogenase family)/acyl carrier protein
MFPKAGDLEQFWANIQNGVDAITEVPPTHWRPEDYFDRDPKAQDRTYATRGGFLSPVDFPPLDFGISPNSLEAIDTTQLLGLMVARQALEDAGYGADRAFDRNRVSVILGVTGTLELVIPLGARLGHPIWRRALQAAGVKETVANEVIQRVSDSYVSWHEDSFPGLLGNVVAGRIANRLDLGGTNCVVDAACASSLSALHLAMLELASDRCDMVLTGGLDTFNDIFMYMCFSKTPALSPTGNARPFDAKADGTILGEGLGILVLKRLEDAERAGDKIYAVIKGIGSSSDGKGQAIYAPRPEGQAKALRQAYRLANVTPDTIELVEAHGTGTRAGDATELTALTEVFQQAPQESPLPDLKPWCALGSVKAQIGHTKAAAGVAGLIKAALALQHKVLPPTIKVDQPVGSLSQGRSPFYINTEKRPWLGRPHHPRRAAVSSFGFGGSNFHCVLEEYRQEKESISWDGSVQILAFSANTREELLQQISEGAKTQEVSPHEMARGRAAFQSEHAYRMALVLERGKSDLARPLNNARSMLERHPEKKAWSIPEGIYFGTGPAPGKLAMIFPGQGSQSVGMFRDLACQFPQMQEALREADAAWLAREDISERVSHPVTKDRRRLSDFIYPHSVFCEEDQRRDEETLRITDIAQPSIGAVGLGAYKILDYFGVRPEAVAGHSYGELVALCAAGRIESRALHSLSILRGRLMADANEGGRGAMLAVRASLDTAQAVLAEEKLELVVANKNAPHQFVLSGLEAEIDRAVDALARRGIESRRLPVSAAFHSSIVAGVRPAFLAGLEEVEFAPGFIPAFANTTAQKYPDQAQECRELLAGQLAQPVEFMEEIETMYRFGIRTFVEVGPGNKLSGLIGAILRDREHQTLGLDASSGTHSGIFDLARVIASLAVWGYPVLLSRWEKTPRQPSKGNKPALTIPICGANYVRTKPKMNGDREGARRSDENAGEQGMEDKVRGGREGAMPEKTDEIPSSLPSSPWEQHADRSQAPTQNGDSVAQSSGRPNPPLVAPSSELTRALQTTQENLLALQKLGEQTAQAHRLFLEGQDRALKAFQDLLQQQRQLIGVSLDHPPPPDPGGSPSFSANVSPKVAEIDPPVNAPHPPVSPLSLRERVEPVVRNGDRPEAESRPDDEPVKNVLLEVISEKTGYPPEMLNLEMELDSDLGIDSIKRVEIFSALQERLPQAPQIKSDHLGTLRSLRQIVDFLNTNSSRKAESTGPPTVETKQVQSPGRQPGGTAEAAVAHLFSAVIEVVAEKTGYPPEMLELDMELDSDLGIDSIKRVEIFSALQEKLAEAPAVKSEHLGTLRTLRHVVEFLSGSPFSRRLSLPEPPLPAVKPTSNGRASGTLDNGQSENDPTRKNDASPSQDFIRRYVLTKQPLENQAQRGQIEIAKDSEIWITNDDSRLTESVVGLLATRGYRTSLIDLKNVATLAKPSQLAGLIILTPVGQVGDAFLKHAFHLLQIAGPGLRQSGKTGGSVFASVSRMDGSFGLGPTVLPLSNPISGGLAGLAKTASKEWPEVQCKALDIPADWDDAEAAAAAIVQEMFVAGPVEVGILPGGNSTLQLQEIPIPLTTHHSPLTKEDVVILTGGARGITAELAVALARALSPTLVLLGRTPEPEPEPDWLAKLTEENQIKRALLAHTDSKTTPKEIEEQYRRITAQREVHGNIQRIENAGAKVLYRSVDVRDQEAVKRVVAEILRQFGPIRGLIHGAGVLADRRIEDKTLEQFDRVYGTKVDGLQNLLQALEGDDLKVLVLFSSSTARFGRAGQVDYAVANEVLNKLAQQEARRRPACRVASVNWGPWEGGMVTPFLRKVFENEGVGLIPLEAGADFLVREISQSSDRAVEVIALGANGFLEELPIGNGKFDNNQIDTSSHSPAATHHSPLAFVFEQRLDVEHFPFLRSHVIDGHAVLPLAMTLEWLAHGALHGNPGLVFQGCDALQVLKGVILKGYEPYPLGVFAGKAMREGLVYRVPVELRSFPPGDGSGSSAGREVFHARAEIILAEKLSAEAPEVPEIITRPFSRAKEEIYNEILFHGPDLQGIERIDGCSEQGIVGQVSVAPPSSTWIHQPLRNGWLADPLALDSAFQMMVLWSCEKYGSCSLPCCVGRYRQYRRSFPRETIRVTAAVKETGNHRARADIVFQDSAGQVVARLENYECVIDATLNEAFRRKHLSKETLPTS